MNDLDHSTVTVRKTPEKSRFRLIHWGIFPYFALSESRDLNSNSCFVINSADVEWNIIVHFKEFNSTAIQTRNQLKILPLNHFLCSLFHFNLSFRFPFISFRYAAGCCRCHYWMAIIHPVVYAYGWDSEMALSIVCLVVLSMPKPRHIPIQSESKGKK